MNKHSHFGSICETLEIDIGHRCEDNKRSSNNNNFREQLLSAHACKENAIDWSDFLDKNLWIPPMIAGMIISMKYYATE